jgi:hypothetical protein
VPIKDSVSLGLQCYTAAQLFTVERSTQVTVERSTQVTVERSTQVMVKRSTQVMVKRGMQVFLKESAHAAIGINTFSYIPVIPPDTKYLLSNGSDLAI